MLQTNHGFSQVIGPHYADISAMRSNTFLMGYICFFLLVLCVSEGEPLAQPMPLLTSFFSLLYRQPYCTWSRSF